MTMLKGCNLLCVVSVVREKIAPGDIQFHALWRQLKKTSRNPFFTHTDTQIIRTHVMVTGL